MEGLAILVILVGGLAWCRYVPERDRMYHWGLACTLFFLFGLGDLALQVVRRL